MFLAKKYGHHDFPLPNRRISFNVYTPGSSRALPPSASSPSYHPHVSTPSSSRRSRTHGAVRRIHLASVDSREPSSDTTGCTQRFFRLDRPT